MKLFFVALFSDFMIRIEGKPCPVLAELAHITVIDR